MQITMGQGNIEVTAIELNGTHGVLFRKHLKKHKVGEFVDKAQKRRKTILRKSDTVIWFENLEGARIMQDHIAQSILLMQGVVKAWPQATTARHRKEQG